MDSSNKNIYWPETNELTKPAREVAKILRIHHNTLFRIVKAGKLECVKMGRNSMHFTYDQVCEFINNHRERVIISI